MLCQLTGDVLFICIGIPAARCFKSGGDNIDLRKQWWGHVLPANYAYACMHVQGRRQQCKRSGALALHVESFFKKNFETAIRRKKKTTQSQCLYIFIFTELSNYVQNYYIVPHQTFALLTFCVYIVQFQICVFSNCGGIWYL